MPNSIFEKICIKIPGDERTGRLVGVCGLIVAGLDVPILAPPLPGV